MTILLAPDKFRGSLTAQQVCEAMTEGIQLIDPSINVRALPLADGGEGTALTLTAATAGSWHTTLVKDPLGRSIQAGFGLSPDQTTAFIELAEASGLHRLTPREYDPRQTSTYGTGELIKQAVAYGARHIVLCIGGSATTDAGMGMAAALGWQFRDANGHNLIPNGAALAQVATIQPPDLVQPELTVSVACDVQNTLFGLDGAAFVYGPQKGATPEAVTQLDNGLRHFAGVTSAYFGMDCSAQPGAGAAGGVGYGAIHFLNAKLQPGVQLVMEQVGFDQYLSEADLVLTGEGKIDAQTLQGKLIKGITEKSVATGVPVIALCGTLALDLHALNTLGLTAAFSILNRPQLLTEAVQTAYADIRAATFQAVRLFLSSYARI